MHAHQLITPRLFSQIILNICARDTSADAKTWSSHNPLSGHCAVVALLAQEYFGGIIIRLSLDSVEGYAHFRSHYINRFSSGLDRDFTASQFIARLPSNLPREIRNREQLLANEDTRKRYEKFKSRFKAAASLQKK
ncbi:MAG TPA: hypothetical protein VJ579_03535 [Candidatus Paceibacterota bacterium]|nr:hypothetical protein [Candidatus Paceibacterota bacterium]